MDSIVSCSFHLRSEPAASAVECSVCSAPSELRHKGSKGEREGNGTHLDLSSFVVHSRRPHCSPLLVREPVRLSEDKLESKDLCEPADEFDGEGVGWRLEFETEFVRWRDREELRLVRGHL